MADTVVILGQQVGDDYTTMAAAKAAVPADIVATGGNWIIQIRADANYGKIGAIPQSTTDSTHKLIIEAFPGDEVDGSGVGAGIEQINVSDLIGQTNVAYTTDTIFRNIKIITSGASRRAINMSLGSNIVFENCFIKSADYWAVVGQNGASVNWKYINCVIADSVINIRLGNPGSGANYSFIGCSSVNSVNNAFDGITSGSLTVKNCFGFSSSPDFASDVSSGGANSDYLASSDTTATAEAFSTGFNNRTSADFVDYAGGDYNLSSSSQLRNYGSPVGSSIGAILPPVGNPWSHYVTIPESYAPASSITGYVGLITEAVIAKLSSGDQAIFWSNVKNGGGDVRICTNSDGTGQLPVEIVSLDNVGETCQIWYRLGTYTGTGDLYLFIGNASATQPAASATYGSEAVWVDVARRHHLIANNLTDSSGNANATSTSTSAGIDSPIGGSTLLSSASSKITYPNTTFYNSTTNQLTIKAISRIDLVGVADFDIALMDLAVKLWFDDSGAGSRVGAAIFTPTTVTYNPSISASQWYHLAITYDGSTLSLYIDGSLYGTASVTDTGPSSSIDVTTSNKGSTDAYVAGVEFIDGIDSASKIATEYNNQSNPATFYGTPTIAATGGGGGLTISPTGIASGESVGSPSVAVGTITLGVSAIPSEESFGTPTLTSGASLVQPSSIGTEETFGTPSIDVGSVLIEPISIVSEESFGIPEVVSGLTAITPVGIISAEAFGTCLVENLLAVIEPSGIPTDELFGNPVILGGDRIVIPISSRVTWNKVAAYLRGLTFVGSDNDVIIKWLRSEGYEGQYNDAFNLYLAEVEGKTGTLTDKYSNWRNEV